MTNLRRITAGLILILGITLATLFSVTTSQAPRTVQAQGNSGLISINPNIRYAPMVFTATSQTKTQILGGVGSATLEVIGPATAATITCKASNDGGVNYYGVPYTAGAFVSGVQTVIAAGTAITYSGTPSLYFFNLSGFTTIQCATSSTFTGASATVQIVASSNRGIF